jgi:O-antigen/teichoic acid export membrane protein
MTATSPAPVEHTSGAARVLRNTVAVTSAEWFAKLTNFLFVVFVVRTLGEVEYGRYAGAVAFVGLSSVLFELGLTESMQRAIARDPSKTRDLFWNAVGIRLTLAVPALVLVPLAAWLAGYTSAIVTGVALQTGTFLLSALLVPLGLLLTAHERFDVVARLSMILNVVYIVLCVALLSLTRNYLVLILVAFLTMPLHIILTWRALSPAGVMVPPWQMSVGAWPGLIRAGMPFALSSLALTFNFQADTVLLGLLGTTADVGWYNAAYRLIFSLSATVAGFTRSMAPALSRMHATDTQAALRWARGAVVGLTFLTLPAAVGLSVLARPITTFLYGAGYEPSASALAILAWDLPFLAVGAFGGNITTAMNLERRAARVYLAAAVFNVASNVILIPRLGVLAAAIVTVLSDALILAGLYRSLWRSIVPARSWRRLAQILAASVVMGMVVWYSRALPLPLAVGIGILVYLVSSFAFGFRSLKALRAEFELG